MYQREWELTEDIELLLLTNDWDIVQGRRDQTSDEPCEGVEPVHPTSPEVRKSSIGSGDTTEDREEHQQERVEQRSDQDRGG